LHTERLLLVRVGYAKSEGRQQTAARELIDRRQLLGEHDRIATGQHEHAHAELELCSACGRERDRRDRVGSLAADPLAQPEAVEAQPFEVVDEDREARVVQASTDA
jgi:hypothetical protein